MRLDLGDLRTEWQIGHVDDRIREASGIPVGRAKHDGRRRRGRASFEHLIREGHEAGRDRRELRSHDELALHIQGLGITHDHPDVATGDQTPDGDRAMTWRVRDTGATHEGREGQTRVVVRRDGRTIRDGRLGGNFAI